MSGAAVCLAASLFINVTFVKGVSSFPRLLIFDQFANTQFVILTKCLVAVRTLKTPALPAV